MIESFCPLEGKILQILNENGEADPKLDPGLPADALKKIYRHMFLARAADIKTLKLQRQGRLGTFAPSIGHEACQVGSAFALGPRDFIFPYFRDLGAYITAGFPLKNYLLYWMGHEEGMKIPEQVNVFTISIPVGSQLPHAVGFARAASIRKDPIAVLAYFGDGATSEGDFNEALNFAGVWKTPNVFVCVNNQYAISTPVRMQTASPTFAQKAVSFGFDGVRVDGNDALAMYAATREALDKARRNGGPTLIEAFTYRRGSHTTSDDASRYRREEEVREWERKDPLDRFRIYLHNKDLWNEVFEEQIQKETETMINAAVEEAEKTPLPSVEELFIHTYKETPPRLREQLDDFKNFLKEAGR